MFKLYILLNLVLLKLIEGLLWLEQVIHFVKICAKKKGFVILEQKDFIVVMKNPGTCSSNPHPAISHTDADDLVMRALSL